MTTMGNFTERHRRSLGIARCYVVVWACHSQVSLDMWRLDEAHDSLVTTLGGIDFR